MLWCHTLLEPSLRLLGMQALDAIVDNTENTVTSIDPLR
jgi:hypothetical protein